MNGQTSPGRRDERNGPHWRETRPQVWLEIVRGRARQRRRPVRSAVFLLGSADDCDLVLADTQLPAAHTYLYVRADGVSVRWLGDGPPLAVDGVEVESARLADGDVLTLAGFAFRVHIDDHRLWRRDREEARQAPHDGLQLLAPDDAEWSELTAGLQDVFERGQRLRLYVGPESAAPRNRAAA